MGGGVLGQFGPTFASLFADGWHCDHADCDEAWPAEKDAATADAIVLHWATRHPKEAAQITGKNPEELARKYAPEVSHD